MPGAGAPSTIVIGIACAALSSMAFTLNDAAIKYLSSGFPLHEITLLRAVIAMIITLAIIMPLEGGYRNLRTNRPWLHVSRGLLVVAANMTFFLSLATIPLSEATAIFFVAPLVITVFSVIFLGEEVGVHRWLGVVVGLAGAVIMLRPGTASFQYAALLPLAAALCYAGLHTLTRKIGATEKASTMAFYIQLSFICVSGLVGLAFGDGRFADTGGGATEFLLRAWVWPAPADYPFLLGIGAASAVGGYLISQAYRLCEAAVIAPFEYLALVLAIVWGIWFFDEWPDMIAWIGIGLVLCGGLYVFWRETVLSKSIASKRPMPRHR